MQSLPELVFTELPLREVATEALGARPLIVTDPYNYPAMARIAQAVCVEDQLAEHIEQVRRDFFFERIVAVGGCTALDFGRACAVGKEVVAVPTILSTSCLSTNRSVINRNGVYKSERTQAPGRTIISMPTILENHRDQVKKWSISGLGDLFSSISAAIEFEYVAGGNSFNGLSSETVISCIPATHQAMNWVLNSLKSFDRDNLERLAWHLHEASLHIITKDQAVLNAASEHWLYYKMQERQKYPKMVATHGKIVSIGTLLSSSMFFEATGDSWLIEQVRKIHGRLGLPLTYADLADLGVTRDHVLSGLSDLSDRDCLYSNYFLHNDFSIVDRVFT
jgi:glycerol dehydrogenase-like iron-containing ADH family enzyme